MRYLSTRKPILGLLLLTVTVTAAGCATGATPTENPNVDQLGEYLFRYNGIDLMVVLGYRFAANNIAEEWLILELAASSPTSKSAKILREKVFVRTPDGTRIPMATQAEFAEAYGSLRAKLRRAGIMRDPMGYFPANRRPCTLAFFAEPGRGLAFEEVTVNDQLACQGKAFFVVPGGTQAGRWVLGIDLDEESIRIPFRL